MLTLSPEELHKFTNRAKKVDQQAWLDERNIPYRVEVERGGKVRLLVSRSMADQWLSGKELPVYREPNLAGVR